MRKKLTRPTKESDIKVLEIKELVGYQDKPYRQKQLLVKKSKANVTVSIRDDASELLEKQYKTIIRSSGQKLEFLKYLIGLYSLYSRRGCEMPIKIIAEAIDTSANSVSLYLREFVELGILEQVSKSYLVGSFSKTYKCKCPDLHKIHTKVMHYNVRGKMRKKIKTMETLLKLKPLREDAWKDVRNLMKRALEEQHYFEGKKDLFSQRTSLACFSHYGKAKVTKEFDAEYNTPVMCYRAYRRFDWILDPWDVHKADKRKSETALGECYQVTFDMAMKSLRDEKRFFNSPTGRKLNLTRGSVLIPNLHLRKVYQWDTKDKPPLYTPVPPKGMKIKTTKLNNEIFGKLSKLVSLYKFYPEDLLKDISKYSSILSSYGDLFEKLGNKKSLMMVLFKFYNRHMRSAILYKKTLIKEKVKISKEILLNGIEWLMTSVPKYFLQDENSTERTLKIELRKWKRFRNFVKLPYKPITT